MREGYWVVRTYESGIIGEKTKFWVSGQRPAGKSRRREKAELKKQEQNEYSAVKRMARLMHANFRHGDLLIGLDYSGAGMEKLISWAKKKNPGFADMPEEERQAVLFEAARHQAELCIRRVSRAMRLEGEELKYICITSDMDGDTGESVQVHHHLMVQADCAALFIEKWRAMGGVHYDSISRQADYTPIAEYFLKQVRRVKDENKFTSSRNLVRPQPKDRAAMSDAELRIPKGAKLLFRQEYRSRGERSYQPQYIRYIIPQACREAGGDSDGEPEANRKRKGDTQ